MSKRVDEHSIRRFFLGLFKPHKKELAIIISIAAFGSILAAFVPYIYGRLFDLAMVPNTPITLLLSLIGIWAVLGLISNFTSARTYALGDTLGAKLSIESEVEAYGHFLTLPISFHKTKRIGEILQKVSYGCWNIVQFIQVVSGVLPSIIVLMLSLAAMLLIQWQLGAIVIFAFIVHSIATLRLTKPVLESQESMRETFDKEYGYVYDRLYNVSLIKNFAMEESEKKQFLKSLVGKAIPVYRNSVEKSARLNLIQGIIYNLSFVIVLGSAIFFLRNSQITHGEFIMFFGYIALAFSPFFRLSEFYNFYKRVSVGIKRIIKLKNLAPESMKHGDETIKGFAGGINFKDISFSYIKDREILKDIDLKINPGESVALVGESGVGKPTLTELIFGYSPPPKGSIALQGLFL